MAITTIRSNSVILLLTAVLISLAADQSIADEAVTIRLTDGSKLIAQVHPRTDDKQLWLQFGGGNAIILRAVKWDRIAKASKGDEPVDAKALRQMAARPVDEVESVAPTNQPAEELSYADQARDLLGFSRPVKSVDFEVRIANWDQDVEFDGIALRLLPLDTDGQLTRARGTLNVELFAARRQKFNDAPSARGQLPSLLGRWSVAVPNEDVTPNGIVFKLPFQTNHPEFDTTWATHGLVHIRFAVPGQGVFENSFDGVRVRPYAPLRDAMERNQQPRFLPTERTGLSKHVR